MKEGREKAAVTADSHVVVLFLANRTEIWTCQLLLAWFLFLDWYQQSAPVLPFGPWFSHHKTLDLRNSYMAVS